VEVTPENRGLEFPKITSEIMKYLKADFKELSRAWWLHFCLKE